MPGNVGDDQSVMPGAAPAVLPDGNDQQALPSPDDLGLTAGNQLPSMAPPAVQPNLVLQTMPDAAQPAPHIAESPMPVAPAAEAVITPQQEAAPPAPTPTPAPEAIPASAPAALPVIPTPTQRKSPINPVVGGALALVLGIGIFSGLLLVRQNQDVRQQAYVAPEKQISQLDYPQAVKANVVGRVCPMTDKYVAGTVYFFNTEEQSLIKTDIPEKMDLFDVQIPAGNYIIAFVPNNRDYPNYAYTDYVRCGLNPDQCKDHRPLVITVKGGDKIGQIKLCDPQYVQEGLPEQLEYENI